MELDYEHLIKILMWLVLGMIHTWRPWTLSIFQDPLPPFSSTSKILLHPRPWMSNFKWIPPLQVITNQQKENIIQEWLLYVIRLSGPSFRWAFVFSINSLILPCFLSFVWLSFWVLFTVYVNEKKSKQKQTKLRHIEVDHVMYCSLYPTNNVMIPLNDGFIVWLQSDMEDFLSVIYQYLAQYDVWPRCKSNSF